MEKVLTTGLKCAFPFFKGRTNSINIKSPAKGIKNRAELLVNRAQEAKNAEITNLLIPKHPF